MESHKIHVPNHQPVMNHGHFMSRYVHFFLFHLREVWKNGTEASYGPVPGSPRCRKTFAGGRLKMDVSMGTPIFRPCSRENG